MLNTFDLMAALTEACEAKAKNEEVDTDSDIELTGNIDEVFSEFEYIVACENASFIEDMNTAYGFMVETTTNTSLSKEDKSALIEASGKSVKDRLVDLINKIIGAIKSLLTKIKNFFVELGKKIKNFFSKKDKKGKNVEQKLKESGKENEKITRLALPAPAPKALPAGSSSASDDSSEESSGSTVHKWKNKFINKDGLAYLQKEFMASSVTLNDYIKELSREGADYHTEGNIEDRDSISEKLYKNFNMENAGDLSTTIMNYVSNGGDEPTAKEAVTIVKKTESLISSYEGIGSSYIKNLTNIRNNISDMIVNTQDAKYIQTALNNNISFTNTYTGTLIKAIRMRTNEYMAIINKAANSASGEE